MHCSGMPEYMRMNFFRDTGIKRASSSCVMLKNNIPVQNNDEFPETYGVKEGNGMYLAPEGNIRVW